jgi:hypothetical protein
MKSFSSFSLSNSNDKLVIPTVKSFSTISMSSSFSAGMPASKENQVNASIKSFSMSSLNANQMNTSVSSQVDQAMITISSDNDEQDSSSIESLSDDDNASLLNETAIRTTSRTKENMSNFQTPKSMKFRSTDFFNRHQYLNLSESGQKKKKWH